MSQSDDQKPSEKEHDASAKKLEDARKQGDVARSTELTAAAAYAGLTLAGLSASTAIMAAGTAGMVILDQAPDLARLNLENGQAFFGGLLRSVLFAVVLLLGLPALLCLLMLIVQRALVVAPSKLQPKLSRISPLATAKKKFGFEGLMEFGKSFLKLLLVSIALTWLLLAHSEPLLATAGMAPVLGLGFLWQVMGQFLALVIALTLALGGIDYLWQRQALMRRNRMSRKELMDETKESEGDPHTKAVRKQRGQDLALNQMLHDVETAQVVIVNPTHYAVALAWQRGARTAPVVVAKGVDNVAQRIRERAAEHGVPLHSDPPTARLLFATVDIGAPVNREHFKAVAAAIRFAELMRKKARSR